MTGLNRQAFEALLPRFAPVYERSLFNPLSTCHRAPAGGRKGTLRTMDEKFVYVLLYCKCYPTLDLLNGLFNFDRSCAHAWVHRLLPILETPLGEQQVVPVRKLRSLAEFIERFPAVQEVMVNGTERPVQRPQDPERQKDHYSGKKKRHTRQHITDSTRNKRVMILTKARAGTVHDKRQLDEAEIVESVPDEEAIEGNLGFQGLQNELVNVHLPHQKPKGKELTELQKQENREFSRQRVVCEHAHAGIKRYHSGSAVDRNRVPDFDDG